MQQNVLAYSSVNRAPAGQFWSGAHLWHSTNEGVESRCTVGWHGKFFRDYYRFCSPASRLTTTDYVRGYYEALGYAVTSKTKLQFEHGSKRLAKFIGVSELRFGRSVRAVVTAADNGPSVVKLVYNIRTTTGVRVISSQNSNKIEEEVRRLVDWCRRRHEADA